MFIERDNGDTIQQNYKHFGKIIWLTQKELITESKVKEWEHLKKVSEAKKKKALEEKKAIVSKLNGLTLNFKATAGDSDKLFGAVTHLEISKELEKHGFSVDKRDIVLDEQIKILGKHKAHVKFAEGLVAELSINVERA